MNATLVGLLSVSLGLSVAAGPLGADSATPGQPSQGVCVCLISRNPLTPAIGTCLMEITVECKPGSCPGNGCEAYIKSCRSLGPAQGGPPGSPGCCGDTVGQPVFLLGYGLSLTIQNCIAAPLPIDYVPCGDVLTITVGVTDFHCSPDPQQIGVDTTYFFCGNCD